MRRIVILLTAVSFIAIACCACQISAEKLGVEETGQAYGDSTGAVVIRPNIDDVFELAGEDGGQVTQNPDYHTLAVNGYLLGGWYDDRWIEWEELYPMLPKEDNYKIYIDGQYQGIGRGRKEPENEVELYDGPQVCFPDGEYGYDGYNMVVAYSGPGDLQVESGTVIPADNERYTNILREYLLENGLPDGFDLTNIVKIDLDSDGQDEVFIQAYYEEDPIHKSMGIQYMRKVLDGEVKEFMIPLTMPTVPEDHLKITGFCDINGDGSKELLISAMGVGYHSYMVYEFKSNGFTRIFENGGEH